MQTLNLLTCHTTVKLFFTCCDSTYFFAKTVNDVCFCYTRNYYSTTKKKQIIIIMNYFNYNVQNCLLSVRQTSIGETYVRQWTFYG